MLENFNEGRSKSFFCIATALLPIDDLEIGLQESKQQIIEQEINSKDLKARSKILRENLNKQATAKSIILKLKRK